MKFIAEIDVMPLKALLDPQGKAVAAGLHNIGFAQIGDVRVGKHISMEITAPNEKSAHEIIERACSELLVNPIIESCQFTVRKS